MKGKINLIGWYCYKHALNDHKSLILGRVAQHRKQWGKKRNEVNSQQINNTEIEERGRKRHLAIGRYGKIVRETYPTLLVR